MSVRFRLVLVVLPTGKALVAILKTIRILVKIFYEKVPRSTAALPALTSYNNCIYRSADKSIARSGRKQANVSVRMACISFGALPCWGGGLDDSSRLDVVEIARLPDMLPSLFPFWSG